MHNLPVVLYTYSVNWNFPSLFNAYILSLIPVHNFNSTSILFCIYFPRFSCLYCKLIKLNSSKSPIYLYVSGGNEDCYYYYYMCYDFDVDYFEHFIIIIVVISYHSEDWWLQCQQCWWCCWKWHENAANDHDFKRQRQNETVTECENLGNSLLLPNELIKIQAVLAEKFY